MENYDFNKSWPKIKQELTRIHQGATEIIKKGETEFLKFSKEGKKQIDLAGLNLKREHLIYLIGKEYVKTKFAARPNKSLQKLILDFKKVENDLRNFRKK